MESSLQRKEQRPEPAGFPLRPLVLSLAVHAAVLAWWLPPLFDDAFALPPAAVLRGTLLPAPARTADAVTPAPTFFRDVKPEPVSRSRPVAAPAPVPSFLPTTLPQDAGGVAVPRETLVPANVALAADVVVAEPGPDPAGLRQFRLALAGEARRFRRYPDAARRAGLVGTAEVRVAVEAGGLNRNASIARSSGHALLDTAALDMLQQAAGQAALPESLRGQRFTVLLPVVFEVAE